MKKFRISLPAYILFFLTTALFSACTEDITIKTDNSAPVLVVYGTLTDQLKKQEIQLSSSSGYFDTEANLRISGATVTLQEDSNNVVRTYNLIEDSSKAGIYKTEQPMAGSPGWKYTLTVVTDFDKDGKVETYEAETVMEHLTPLDSINITKEKKGEYTYFSLNMSAQDQANVDDYYLCKYQINDSVYSKISKYIPFEDTSLDGQYVSNLSIWFFNDINDKSKFSDDEIEDMVFMESGDKVIAEIDRISKGYYDFLRQCQSEINGSNPMFGGPPANISTNLSNGARGYFTAYCTSSKACVAP